MLEIFTVEQFNKHRSGDIQIHREIRFHWEVYRAKFIFNVCMAYKIQGDIKYLKAIENYLNHYKQYCPIYHCNIPYNGMEASILLINLSWIGVILREDENFERKFISILHSYMLDLINYIYRNYEISFYGLESNHSICCNIGLIFGSLYFTDHPHHDKWFSFGVKNLKRNLKEQYSSDGVNYESAINYHRFVFEMLLFLYSALIQNNRPIDFLKSSLIKQGRALNSLKHINGNISRFGDNDGGKFLYDLETLTEFLSIEYLAWFNDSNTSMYYETLLFENTQDIKNLNLLEYDKGTIGKYFRFSSKYLSFIMTYNNIGTNGKGNHQHNDFFSFEITGRYPFIIDKWSYCYTGEKNLRNIDRDSRSHNCLTLDNHQIVEFNQDRLFEMLGNLKIESSEIKNQENHIVATFSHNGYRKAKFGYTKYSRGFNINKSSHELKIIDSLVGEGNHFASMSFFIPLKYYKLSKDNTDLLFSNEHEIFTIKHTWNNFTITEEKISENFLSYSPAYKITLFTNYLDSIELEVKITYKTI